ncbi:MAG TPA: hypothetical protein VJX67_11250 [Blastocatellia bacterium]|nr:hypothetical protein [Blastocatellia bacterium]
MFDFDRGKQAFDGALSLGSDLVVVEAKGKYLTVDAKYDGDRGKLREQLEDKFGKGVRQLTRNLELVFNLEKPKRKTFSELGPDRRPINTFGETQIQKVRRVYPIIVVQDFSLELGFANWNLREQFRSEIASKSIASDLVRPLAVITVEDLEYLLTHANQVPIQNVLDYYARNLEPIYSFKQIFARYMKVRGVRRRDNPWVESRVAEIFDSMRAMFRNP